jgi:hypothetical protein
MQYLCIQAVPSSRALQCFKSSCPKFDSRLGRGVGQVWYYRQCLCSWYREDSYVGTDRRRLTEEAFAFKGTMIERYSQELAAMKKISEPEDVAKLVSFFGSTDSDHATG